MTASQIYRIYDQPIIHSYLRKICPDSFLRDDLQSFIYLELCKDNKLLNKPPTLHLSHIFSVINNHYFSNTSTFYRHYRRHHTQLETIPDIIDQKEYKDTDTYQERLDLVLNTIKHVRDYFNHINTIAFQFHHKKIYNLYLDGYTLQKISNVIDYSYSSVQKSIKATNQLIEKELGYKTYKILKEYIKYKQNI
jgi:hypothetical protein